METIISKCRNNNIPQLKGFVFALDKGYLYMQKDKQSICICENKKESSNLFYWLNLFKNDLNHRNWTRKHFKNYKNFHGYLRYGLSFF